MILSTRPSQKFELAAHSRERQHTEGRIPSQPQGRSCPNTWRNVFGSPPGLLAFSFCFLLKYLMRSKIVIRHGITISEPKDAFIIKRSGARRRAEIRQFLHKLRLFVFDPSHGVFKYRLDPLRVNCAAQFCAFSVKKAWCECYIMPRSSAGASGGRIEGNLAASIDLPAPGGPTMSRLWPPAAATSSARLALSWPLMSARSS